MYIYKVFGKPVQFWVSYISDIIGAMGGSVLLKVEKVHVSSRCCCKSDI